MKAVVIGGNGQLGTDVVRSLSQAGFEAVAVDHSAVEITSVDSVASFAAEARPGVIVNTAALHHVERCEQNPECAYAVNAVGPQNLAMVAEKMRAVLVQVSTDYVFDGAKRDPYVETDTPHPLNTYGKTKLAGEHFVRAIAPRHFVVRTSALYGHSACRGKGGRNFVELMLKLAGERDEVRVVDDEIVSPTWTGEVAEQITELVQTDAYGLYHATAEESCSWYEFAREIFQLSGCDVKLAVASSDEFPAKVPRPKYSVLENQSLKAVGLNRFRHWRDGLREYLSCRQ